MKLKFAFLALLSLSPFANADLVLPHPRSEKVTVSGADAVNLYDALDVVQIVEAALRTSTTSVKVFRAESGLTQMVCHKVVSRAAKETTGTCVLEKSKDNQPLAKYIPRRIAG